MASEMGARVWRIVFCVHCYSLVSLSEIGPGIMFGIFCPRRLYNGEIEGVCWRWCFFRINSVGL